MPCRPNFFFCCFAGAWLFSLSSALADQQPIDSSLPEHAAASFRLRLLTANNELPQSRVSCIKQTRDGYMWLGTWYGLARFDGRHVKEFNKFTTPELGTGEINGLAEDQDGTLWIATRQGLVSYRDHRFERLSTNPALREDLWRLNAGGAGLWMDGGTFVARLQRGRVQSTRLPRGNPILCMCESEDGGLHLLAHQQWLTWLPDRGQFRTNFSLEPGPAEWQCAVLDTDGKGAWIGTGENLFRLERGSLIPAPVTGHPAAVNFLVRDRDGNVWANVRDVGLFRRVNGSWEMIVPGDRFSTGISCFAHDQEGSFWVGTDQGVLQLQAAPVKSFSIAEGLVNNEARSVCESVDNTIWVATTRGLSRIQNDRVVPLGVAEPAIDSADSAVWPRPTGGVWLGKASRGLHDFHNGGFHDWEGIVPLTFVGSMCGDRQGGLWMAAAEGLISVKDNLAICHSNAFPAGLKPKIYGMACDHNGAIWFGTKEHGLGRLRDDHCAFFAEKDGLGRGSVFAIHEDADQVLWLATENGLVRFKQGRFFTFGREQGLLELNINCVLEDDFGYLWLSGIHGIYAIERRKLNDVAEGRASTVPCFALGNADGMNNVETNGGENQPAGWKARDGRLYFPTLAGVVAIDPRAIPLHESPPLVRIEQVKGNDKLVWPADSGSGVTLGRRDPPAGAVAMKAGSGRVVEFSYTAATFIEPERARFRYRLAGPAFGTQWHEQTEDRTARFYNLAPGKYRFEVLGANHHNVWSPQPTPFEFSVAPFFWQTRTFYGLCAAGVLGLALLVHRYRLKWQRRLLKVEEQRALSNERSRIARDLHDDIGGSLTGIALQLEAARRRGSANKDEVGVLAEEARVLSRELRELAWTTNPRCDNTVSLVAFIGESAERFCHAAGVECRLCLPASDGSEAVPARVRYELLAVLKESLTNTAKHAQARTVTVDLAANNGDLQLTIKDDGKGCDPSTPAAGSGLRNMRERVQQAGGWLKFESQPGGGTTVIACLPRKTSEKQ